MYFLILYCTDIAYGDRQKSFFLQIRRFMLYVFAYIPYPKQYYLYYLDFSN